MYGQDNRFPPEETSMSRSEYPTARPFLPEDKNLDQLADAAAGCQGCPLFEDADQVVFGTGPEDADIMLVGEQPGRREDRTGQPFVGPSGEALNQALQETGIARDEVYLTNAVKHFKSRKVDGHRTGVKPAKGEISACRPWLESEIEVVEPEIIVALGAVAARSLTKSSITVGEALGSWLETGEGRDLIVTFHPGAVIRAPEGVDEDQIFDAIVEALSRAREAVSPTSPGSQPRA